MSRLDSFQAFHPFTRLARLLDGIAPGPSPAPDGAPILLSLGEPRHRPPDFVTEVLSVNAAGWSRYPPPRGTAAYRQAAADWLARRYGLEAGVVDPDAALLPLPGTREGLFFAALTSAASAAGGAPPLVLLPNPFYHVYLGGALAAGAEPYPVAAADGLPDIAALPTEVLDRAALCYYCTPANPQGAVADRDRLCDLIRLARAHDFVLALDECYAEIYTGAPPPGALEAAQALGGDLDNLLIFHSLSKRSSAPGLRCGFVVGDPALVDGLDRALRVGGAGVPLPVLAAGTHLWQDDGHATANRLLYQEKFRIAEARLGGRFGFQVPPGGFFLWLEVGDGEAAAEALWREAGIKVLPGSYTSAPGVDGQDPGRAFIRVALVDEAPLVEAALVRLAEILS